MIGKLPSKVARKLGLPTNYFNTSFADDLEKVKDEYQRDLAELEFLEKRNPEFWNSVPWAADRQKWKDEGCPQLEEEDAWLLVQGKSPRFRDHFINHFRNWARAYWLAPETRRALRRPYEEKRRQRAMERRRLAALNQAKGNDGDESAL